MNKYELEPEDKNIYDSLLDDKLNNKEYLMSLIRLISKITDNGVICVDGDWGVGKTFLIKQLQYLINNYKKDNEMNQFKCFDDEKENLMSIIENNLVFYYNAWENDDHGNPFESIIYNILDAYPNYKDVITNKFEDKELLKEILNILTKILTNKLFNIDFNAENIDKIKTFDDLSKEINTKEEKKKLFKELIDKILAEKRMILIIDELDRCNPIYATRILETIKHFYNLKNITIIVIANNYELKNIINQQFGANFNSYSYLNKFYDYTITIDNIRSIEYCKRYLEFRDSTYLPHDVFYSMIEKYKFTLRDCNRYKTIYDVAKDYIEGDKDGSMYLNKKENTILYSIILPIIYAFKIKDIEAYNECINKKTNKLKEALKYVKNYMDLTKRERWLYDFIDIPNDMQEISDEYLYDKMIDIFVKISNSQNFNKIFMRAIKVSL